jgi:hypothetical protein
MLKGKLTMSVTNAKTWMGFTYGFLAEAGNVMTILASCRCLYLGMWSVKCDLLIREMDT